MTDRLYIDGRDAYAQYGVFITEEGYNPLVAFPPLKAVGSNNWPEEDGEEADLWDPKLDSQEITLKFGARGRIRTGLFIERISDGAYHTFDFKSIGRSYRLRLVSQPSLELTEGLETFSLRLANDFPLSGEYLYQAPACTLVAPSGYELDGRDLAEYGVSILRGSEAEICKSPAAKKNLLQNLKHLHGAIYDQKQVNFQPKDIRLSCLMRARNLDEFWRNYDALLYDLSRPQERILYADKTGYEYTCYYKNCSVSRFEPMDKIWLAFELNLAFTSFRVERDLSLLSSERGEWILSENDFAIDLTE